MLSRCTVQKKTLLPLSLILIVGALLRLYRLPEQSVWFDEWLHINLLGSPDMSTFFSRFLFYAPEQAAAPFYYFVFYLSSRVVGSDSLALRLLPLFLGVLSISFLFWLGAMIRNNRTGLVAATLLAISPQHIWYSQEPRPYTLLVFLALLSLILLIAASNHPKKRVLLLHCLVSATLVFTHAFAFLVLIPQGIYLCLRRRFGYCLTWSVTNGIFVLTIFYLILNTPHISVNPQLYAPAPPIAAVGLRALLKDIVHWHFDLMPIWSTDAISPLPHWLAAVLRFHAGVDTLLLVITLGIFCLFVMLLAGTLAARFAPWNMGNSIGSASGWRFALYGRSAEKQLSDTPAKNNYDVSISNYVLLILLVFFSAFALASCQIIFKRPFSGPNYDLYNSIGLYLLMGIVLSLFDKGVYRMILTALIILYGYQCLIFLPFSTRPEWRQGAAYIKANLSEHDLILDEWTLAPASRRTPYLETVPVPMRFAASYTDACHQSALYFIERANKFDEHPADDASVWMLTEPPYLRMAMPHDVHPLDVLQAGLTEYGLQGEMREFPGGSNLTVVRIRPHPEHTPRIPFPYAQSLHMLDYEAILTALGLSSENEEEYTTWLATLQRVVGLWPPIYLHSYVGMTLMLLMEDEWTLAEALAAYVVREHPFYGLGYFATGMVLAAHGKNARAVSYFSHAFSYYPAIEDVYRPFVEAMCLHQDYPQAEQSLTLLKDFPYPLFHDAAAHLLRKRLGNSYHDVQNSALSFLADGADANMLQFGLNEHEMSNTTAYADQHAFNNESTTWIMDETAFPPGKSSWLEQIFEAQQQQTGIAFWTPLRKHVPGVRADIHAVVMGNVAYAIDAYEKQMTRFPFEYHFYERFNVYLLQLNDPEQYVRRWRERAHFNPEAKIFVAGLLADAGVSWLGTRDYAAATLAYETAYLLDPSNGRYLLRLGQLYDFSNRPALALQCYEQVLAHMPDMQHIAERITVLSGKNIAADAPSEMP